MTTSTSITLGATGAVVSSIEEIYSGVLQNANDTAPTIATDMPAELVAAIVQTSAYAIKQCADMAGLVINSVTPYGVNDFMLLAQGAQYGFEINEFSRTSVYVVFSGVAGSVIPKGTVISDGTHQYQTVDQDILSGGGAATIYAQATVDGAWAVPVASVVNVITSFPVGYGITCTNTAAGYPSNGGETIPEYRGRILAAFKINAVATIPYLKALLYALGIPKRLVSVAANLQNIYIGGTFDNYQAANAIFNSGINYASLLGTTTVTITDYPNSYPIKFTIAASVLPSLQITWKTDLAGISAPAVAAVVKTAMADHMNSLPIGEGLNGVTMTNIFLTAVANIMDKQHVTSLAFTVSYDGVSITPSDSVYVLAANKYLLATTSNVGVTAI
jgi:Baseplate J-like protein